MPSRKPRIQIYLDEETHQRLTEYAEEKGLSESGAGLKIIQAFFSDSDEELPSESLESSELEKQIGRAFYAIQRLEEKHETLSESKEELSRGVTGLANGFKTLFQQVQEHDKFIKESRNKEQLSSEDVALGLKRRDIKQISFAKESGETITMPSPIAKEKSPPEKTPAEEKSEALPRSADLDPQLLKPIARKDLESDELKKIKRLLRHKHCVYSHNTGVCIYWGGTRKGNYGLENPLHAKIYNSRQTASNIAYRANKKQTPDRGIKPIYEPVPAIDVWLYVRKKSDRETLLNSWGVT